ncbi:hypothetical protein JHK85_050972 [Glycine max]|nr:hypothetical protein JHK85_050972 [Glycine max]
MRRIGFCWMGNKLGRRGQVVDEKYRRPQGLYNHKDVDHKKLRKLILESKLAPCYPGYEETTYDREECPICFLVRGTTGFKDNGLLAQLMGRKIYDNE